VKHIWSVLCTLVITDQTRNNVSLIEVVEQLRVRPHSEKEIKDEVNKGAISASMNLVTLWYRSKHDEAEAGLSRLSFLSPDGQALFGPSTQEIDLTSYQRVRSTVGIQGIPFTVNGDYRFLVEMHDKETDQWEQVASVPLEIIEDASIE